MSADRPLTDAQERFLIALDDADGDAAPEMHSLNWVLRAAGVRNDPRTRASLRSMGLIETAGAGFAMLTEAGVAMLRSMGD